MSSQESHNLDRISQYEEQGRNALAEHMDIDDQNADQLEKGLDALIQQYEARLKNQQEELKQLQERAVPLGSIMTPSTDPQERLKQLRTLKLAYGTVTNSKPDLPAPKSVIPRLLAIEQLNKGNTEARKAVDSHMDKLEWAERHAKDEENRLADSSSLANALNDRITRLETKQGEQSSLGPAEASRRLLQAKVDRKHEFDVDTTRLNEALTVFVQSHLGSMIAAEEIGGPVVGDLRNISEDMLTSGFSTQGKPKPTTAKPISDSKRQRRIDDIWGTRAGHGQPSSEDEAAIAEMNHLIEALLEIARSHAGSYLDLERDSAASRFLVRSKVAQFHPKDARKLRLLDFGRELND